MYVLKILSILLIYIYICIYILYFIYYFLDLSPRLNSGKLGFSKILKLSVGRGVQKTHKPTKPDPDSTCWVGSVFRAWWVGLGWVTKFFLIAGQVGFGS